MVNIDFQAGGIHYRESDLKVYFCAIIETSENGCKVMIRHFLASDDQEAETKIEEQNIEDPENGFSRRFSNPEPLKPVLDQLNMEVTDEGGLCELEES